MKNKIQRDLSSYLKLLEEVSGLHVIYNLPVYRKQINLFMFYVGSNEKYVVNVEINL